MKGLLIASCARSVKPDDAAVKFTSDSSITAIDFPRKISKMLLSSHLSTLLRRACLAIFAAVLLVPSAARADLMLYPTRVVMTGNQRSAQVEIINRGTGPETYRINIVNRRMSETGEIVEAPELQPGEQFADAMLVYTPRQVTLQPGESQTIRVSVRKPTGLTDGEYRSHLQFDRVADATGASDLENTARPQAGQVAIQMAALVGASIPVIVRHGPTNATVTLSGAELIPAKDEAKPLLAFTFNRMGNQSVYGDILATYTPSSGKAVEIGKVDGVAVYVPNATRTVRIPLTMPEGMALKGGTIKLTFSERPDAGGKRLAEASVTVP